MTHEEAEAAARRDFDEGLRLLRRCADALRGPGLPPSPVTMRTEMAVSRAIETLSSNGFRVGKP